MIHLVIALRCEAQPVIRHYRLKRDHSERAYEIWGGEDVRLIVCGTGKAAAAAATAHVSDRASTGMDRAQAFVNLGTSGHARMPPGNAALAHRVVDAGSSRSWYPQFVSSPPCLGASVITVDRPETVCPEDALYDMEAAGFCAAAWRYSSAELIQCLKIVSDNPSYPLVPGRDRHRVQAMIERQLPCLERLLEELRALCAELDRRGHWPERWAPLAEPEGFSFSQRARLRTLLGRWRAALADEPLPFPPERPPPAAKALNLLQTRLDHHGKGER